MYGNDNVVASDIRKASDEFMATGPFVYADVMNYSMLERIVVDWRIGKFNNVLVKVRRWQLFVRSKKIEKEMGLFSFPFLFFHPTVYCLDEQFFHPCGTILLFSFFFSRI